MTRRSFTLIEMMIGLALIVILVMILLPATNRIMSSTTAAADRNHRLAQVAVLSDVIDRAMLTAVAQDGEGKSGFAGSAESIKITMCGVSMSPRAAGRPDDIQKIEIAFASGAITLRQDGGVRQRLLDGIERCRFEFNSGDGWSESFDGASGLPRAVSVSIWLGAASIDEDDDAGLFSDPFEDSFAEDSERDPDWRRVFAVFDPGAGAETSGTGAM